MPYNLRELASKVLKDLVEKINSCSNGIVITDYPSCNPQSLVGRFFEYEIICLAVSCHLKQPSWTTAKPDDILNLPEFSKLDLKHAYLRLPRDGSLMPVTTVNTASRLSLSMFAF